MALSRLIYGIVTIFFSNIVDYVYHCPIDPLMCLWVNIGPSASIFISRDSDSVSW